jgi:hypothetical protein
LAIPKNVLVRGTSTPYEQWNRKKSCAGSQPTTKPECWFPTSTRIQMLILRYTPRMHSNKVSSCSSVYQEQSAAVWVILSSTRQEKYWLMYSLKCSYLVN